MMDRFLQGRRILILDDDYLAALGVQDLVEDLGGIVVGLVGRLDHARQVVREQQIDGAILDIRLDNVTSYPLARELMEAGTVVVFLTGFEPGSIEPEFRSLPRISKPYNPQQGEHVLRSAFV